MSEKYFDHLDNIHQDMELLWAADIVMIGELLEQVMGNCAQKPFYQLGSGYRFFGASALADSINRQEHFPVNSELFFKN